MTYTKQEWIRVYMDGSATEATTDEREGIYVEWQDGRTKEMSVPGGTHCSSYKAEAMAIQEGAKPVIEYSGTLNAKIVFL